MKTYETLHLVKSEDLNHHGTLFAARGASWLIEAGFATAACEHGNTDEVVLRSINNVSYSKPVKPGSIVRLVSRVVYAGSSSLMVAVCGKNSLTEEVAIEGYLTFVTIDESTGKKKEHGILLDETSDEEELRLRECALSLRK